jgi:hypothetical protein
MPGFASAFNRNERKAGIEMANEMSSMGAAGNLASADERSTQAPKGQVAENIKDQLIAKAKMKRGLSPSVG